MNLASQTEEQDALLLAVQRLRRENLALAHAARRFQDMIDNPQLARHMLIRLECHGVTAENFGKEMDNALAMRRTKA